MITKERLEQLIEKGAIIWVCCWGKLKELDLDGLEYMDIEKDEICYEDTFGCCRTTDLNHLFETKEDAEEYAEFGNITKTERIELPSWEEFKTTETITKFFNKDTNYSLYVYVKNKNTNNCKIMIRADNGEQEWWEFQKPLTRENYNEARRLCVKLFKGEDV